MESWIGAREHAFAFWGGVPSLTVPDNTKTGVSKACRRYPDTTQTDQSSAVHYGFGVLPARPYRPRDKSKVERGEQIAWLNHPFVDSGSHYNWAVSITPARADSRSCSCNGSSPVKSSGQITLPSSAGRDEPFDK